MGNYGRKMSFKRETAQVELVPEFKLVIGGSPPTKKQGSSYERDSRKIF